MNSFNKYEFISYHVSDTAKHLYHNIEVNKINTIAALVYLIFLWDNPTLSN